MRSPERQILLGGLLLALTVSLGVGWLVRHALDGARASVASRHRDVLERLFDEMEEELSSLVAREEARSFLEYRYFYVPDGNAYQAGLVQSELAKLPQDETIVGWFQVDPGGLVSTPVIPRDNELSLALRNGWAADDGASALRDELSQILRDIPGWSEPSRPPVVLPAEKSDRWSGYEGRKLLASSPAPRPMPAPEPIAQLPAPSSLIKLRGSAKRADRQAQVVSTKALNVESFNPGEQQVEQLVAQSNAQQIVKSDSVQAPPPPEESIEVVVSPFSGLRRGNYLVLHRVVRTGPSEEFRQGLVLRVDALIERIESEVLDGSEVLPWLALGWNGQPITGREFRHEHRFAEPFTSLSLAAALHPVPELVGTEARTVRVLAFTLILVIIAGGLALFRAVRTQLEYARRRNDFVAAVSHELKTPLTTIRMYAEMLRDGMIPDPARQHTYHHTITMESDRLGRLISNVLELARLERGGPQPVVLVGSVEPALREAVEIVRPHASQSGFVIEVIAEPDLPPAKIDPDALTQIVVNLVDNAIKFATQGERRIELRLVAERGHTVLTVRDRGPGVPQTHLRRVFEPFWRGERELTRKTRGTGIGLALVRGLSERMGAIVWAKNHPEGGFLVTLRFATA